MRIGNVGKDETGVIGAFQFDALHLGGAGNIGEMRTAGKVCRDVVIDIVVEVISPEAEAVASCQQVIDLDVCTDFPTLGDFRLKERIGEEELRCAAAAMP
jgi:hypothetical protein